MLWWIELEKSSADFQVGDHFDSNGVGFVETLKSHEIDQWLFLDFDFFHLEIQLSDPQDSGFQILIESLRLNYWWSKLILWVVLYDEISLVLVATDLNQEGTIGSSA